MPPTLLVETLDQRERAQAMHSKTEIRHRAQGHSASVGVHYAREPPHTPYPAPTAPSTGPYSDNTGQQQETNYGLPNPAYHAPSTAAYHAPSTDPYSDSTGQQQETNYGLPNPAYHASSPYSAPRLSDSVPRHPSISVSQGCKPEKRKSRRAVQACKNCRRHKTKCDEGQPCGACKINKVTCNYEGDQKRILQILYALDDIKYGVKNLKRSETSEDSQAPKRAKIETHAPSQIRTLTQGSVLHWPSIKELTKTALAELGVQNVDKHPFCFEEQRAYLPLQAHEKGSGRNPDYSRAKVLSLVESFKEIILAVYPIMIPNQLDEMVGIFLDGKASIVQGLIVLTVLALGEVCQNQETMRNNRNSIPGLEYMAVASHFMGEHRGGQTVEHAQIFLLTAIYYDQLGKIVESNLFLTDTERALQNIIMHCDLSKFKKAQADMAVKDVSMEDTNTNSVLIIYWTCLLLQSDVLAVLYLPPETYVLRHEHVLPWPNMGLLEHYFSPGVSKNFQAQLLLRKDPSRLCASMNNGLAGVVPKARLQARFWSAQAVLDRDKIRMVLDRRDHGLPAEVIDEAVRYVATLFMSIDAFHALDKKRLLTTNIFGACHGQWENLLVLAAAYRDRDLSMFVDESRLESLFHQTIVVLEAHAQPHSALMADKRILEIIKRDIFPSPSVPERQA
ncbi:hypothetical protein LY76DRAFT_634057 [Colletotrichum caudatum]|nr:hypothetical protein LY76DRAFT_634057 [Colletotrichum caudatum]